MKIGIVDLDTSHPQNWIPIERELGHEVVGIWDGGAIHPEEYVTKFAADKEVPRIYATLDEMAEDVDLAIVHGCNWETHVPKARPFVAAGKSVLLDKPMAGNLADLRQIVQWVKDGARISGGSSLRFCEEVKEWAAKPVEERGVPHTALCGCGTDEFNYGIHAYSLLSAVMGPGIRSVRHLQAGPQHRIQVNWHDDRTALLVVGDGAYIPFYATMVSVKGVSHLVPQAGKLYRALLESTLPYLAGETAESPSPIEELIEPELCALAARQSWLNGDREVALSDLTEADGGYDGELFAKGYQKMRYPQQ
jgi:hypothetical protein